MKTRKYAILFSITFLILILSCNHTPERYDIYENIVFNNIRLEVLFIGKNWEIKDAVNDGKIKDSEYFHTEDFWNFPNTEPLIVLAIPISESVAMVIPLEQFNRQFQHVAK